MNYNLIENRGNGRNETVETEGLCIIQGDRKITQPILEYLLMVAIQYNSIGLINTQYRSDFTKAKAGHVML
jgi:L-lactate utilization protein LutB